MTTLYIICTSRGIARVLCESFLCMHQIKNQEAAVSYASMLATPLVQVHGKYSVWTIDSSMETFMWHMNIKGSCLIHYTSHICAYLNLTRMLFLKSSTTHHSHYCMSLLQNGLYKYFVRICTSICMLYIKVMRPCVHIKVV